jgi:hypothetical protein
VSFLSGRVGSGLADADALVHELEINVRGRVLIRADRQRDLRSIVLSQKVTASVL